MFDIVGALVGLAMLAALTPFVAFAIILESDGPIFIKCRRVSKGDIIHVYKFRSMVHNAQEKEARVRHLNERSDGPFFKMRDNPALTHVGKLLRKFKLDELPQVINVLKGELSLVGPRPHEPEEVLQYPPEYAHIAQEKAGLTGLPQATGASYLPFRKELELDAHYLNNQSIWMDTKIIAKTAHVIFFGNGI